MADRGMKKRLPFNSLVEQADYLDKMMYEKNKISKPQISIEQARKIDRILREYDGTSNLKIKMYIDGYLYYYEGPVLFIERNKKDIYLNEIKIPIKNIIDIDDPNPFLDIC